MPPGTFHQPNTDVQDEITTAISSPNTYEQTERNTEHGLSFTQAPGMSEMLNDSNQLEPFAGQTECEIFF